MRMADRLARIDALLEAEYPDLAGVPPINMDEPFWSLSRMVRAYGVWFVFNIQNPTRTYVPFFRGTLLSYRRSYARRDMY
jgi:hypothetical protein